MTPPRKPAHRAKKSTPRTTEDAKRAQRVPAAAARAPKGPSGKESKHSADDAREARLARAFDDPHVEPDDKRAALMSNFEDGSDAVLTTDQGVPIPHTDDSLKAGPRGSTLLEDFHLREKIQRFDHERIPERVVHARGSGAHGFFRVYESLEDVTCASFLCDPDARTPVFVRFSTVVGSRGSADTARDVRGFATKFYTSQGNFDLVGNNMPVFFIQDGIKFPDLVHAVKPEPHNEMPQAASAHDTFWDFVSLVPETLHMVMWVMSDRALPRSYRMMEGFGVHTFRLVDAEGRSSLCKFHWKPVLGIRQLVWDEAQKIAGKDADFHRRDLWDAIECGNYPEYELGVQVVPEEDVDAYGFDLLDPTKLLPEELVPVRIVGRMTLNRNPSNFFAETEQVAFCVGNVVPGIDVTEDPLMQARLFSYLDTQLTRLGGPNFADLPINRPVAAVHNHQQDGFGRHPIPTARALYHPNSIAGNSPRLSVHHPGGFQHVAVPVEGTKTRERSASFGDHYSQARLFLNSQSAAERRHLIDACRFELGKVERLAIRERVIGLFRGIDEAFAREVAVAVGVAIEGTTLPPTAATGATSNKRGQPLQRSPALSIDSAPKDSIRTCKIALLIADGVRAADVDAICTALRAEGAVVHLIAPTLAAQRSLEGKPLSPDAALLTTSSVVYDAVAVPGGAASVQTLQALDDALQFVAEAYRHAKPIGAMNEGSELVERACAIDAPGVVIGRGAQLAAFARDWVAAIAKHRFFDREPARLPVRTANRSKGKS